MAINAESGFSNKEFHFSSDELIFHPEVVVSKGVTELEICDEKILSDKNLLEKLLKNFSQKAPDIFLTFSLDISIIDKKLVDLFAGVSCCLLFDFLPSFLDENKKMLKHKINLLNDAGLIFGFCVETKKFGTMKKFKLCIDEIVAYYPNHIYIQNDELKPTDKLSTQDIKTIKRISFALETFYTYGRAVPWFLTVVQSLHLKPNNLIWDFSEWQICNNCGLSESLEKNSFSPDSAPYTEILKMQLSFLQIKYEEKHLNHIFIAASDLIKLHAAFSMCYFDGTETELELSYNPEDLFSPYAMNLASFAEEVCMEMCKIKIYSTENGAEFRIEQ